MVAFEDLTLSVLFMRVVPGTERVVATQLAQHSVDARIFKVIGDYDLAKFDIGEDYTFSPQDAFVQEDHFQYVVDYVGFPCFAFNSNTDDISCREHIERILDTYPLISLTLIHLHHSATEHNRLSFLEKYCRDTQQHKEDQTQESQAILLSSMGQNAGILLLGCASFEDIFSHLLVLRQHYAEDVVATNTIPLISYKAVIHPASYYRLKGNLEAQVAVQFMLGAERILLSQFPVEQYDYRDLLGNFDMMLLTKTPVPASEFFKSLIESRRDAMASGVFYETSTIVSPATHALRAPLQLANVASTITSATKRRSRSIQTALHLLDTISLYQDVDNYVIKQARGLLRRFSAYSIDPWFSSAVSDFDMPLEYQLTSLLSKYKDELFRKQDIHQSAGDFATSIDHFAAALAQRVSAISSYRFGLPNLPEGYSDGTKVSAGAATKLVRYIYSQIENAGLPSGQWSGFIIFSQYFNFGLQPSSILSFPAQALTHVITPTLNWLTVTHEISHDIWIRTKAYETKFGAEKKSIRDIVRGGGRDVRPLSQWQPNAHDMLWEWYAHWFDFRHFYASDIDLYLWAIWSSWLRLPIVRRDLQEYLARSFVISCICKLHELNTVEQDTDEVSFLKALENVYGDMLSKLKILQPIGFAEKQYIEAEQKCNNISRIVYKYWGVINIFEQCLYNEHLAKAFSGQGANIDGDIEAINRGRPVSGCRNPLILLRQLLNALRLRSITNE